VNPGSFRLDLGNETMDIAQKIWKVKSMLDSLKSPDLSFLKLDFSAMMRPSVSAGSASYDEILSMKREDFFPDGDAVSFEDAGKREHLPVVMRNRMNETERASYSYGLSNDIAGMEGIKALSSALYDSKDDKEKKVLENERTGADWTNDAALKILEKLGLSADDLAIVKDIAVNLAKFNEEESRTFILEKELSDIRSENMRNRNLVLQMAGGLYGDTVNRSLRREVM